MEYNLGAIRQLIEAALTLEEFNNLVFDDFHCIHEQFADGQSLPDRIRKLIDYAEKHREIPKLLRLIEEQNCAAFQEFRARDEFKTPSLSALKEEVTSDPEWVEELRKISPKEDSQFWKCVKRVYQDFLLQLDDEPELADEPNHLDDLLWQLQDRTEEVVILEFISRLIAYFSVSHKSSYQNVASELRKWLRNNIGQFTVSLDDFNQSLRKFKKEYRQAFGKVYLIVAIKDNQSYKNSFQVYGWLGTDSIIENTDLDLIPLPTQSSEDSANDERVQENSYTLEETQEIIRDFFKQISLKKAESEQLIVEFFLPSSLLLWDVEKWEIERSSSIYLESTHEVRIRSLDRLSLKYNLYQSTWKKKWISVQKCASPLQHFLPSHCNCNINTLVGQLQNETKLGVKLKSALKLGHQGIASALYRSGTPIAIWLRCDPPEGDCETQLDRLLQERLLDLPQRVFQERCQSERHLTLIWDDPNRLIPTYQLQ
jgi:hypothetical protein